MNINIKLKLYKILAFIKKDFYIERSYKVGFIITIINSILPVFSYFFIDKLMANGQNSEKIYLYGSNYFSFAVIGVAFSTYFHVAIQTFSTSMRRAQMAGCLEAILSSQTDAKTVVFLSSIYSYISSAIFLILMFLISSLFLDFDFSKINILSTLIALFFSLTTFVSLGIFSGAGIIIFKQGDPFGFIFGSISSLLGGAFFPVSLFPNWLNVISYIIPVRYSLDALRLTILQGYSISMISQQLTILGIISVILLPTSLYFFQWAVEKGKKDGTLMQY